MKVEDTMEFPPNRRRFLKQGIALGALAGFDPLASILHGATTIATGKTVEISSGKVRGTVHDGISAFKGIPYGARPVARCALCLPQNRRPGRASATVSHLAINHRKT